MSKILQGLDETRRERVKKALIREASERLEIVNTVAGDYDVERDSREHEALLRWAFGGLSYSVEEIDRQLQTQEVNR